MRVLLVTALVAGGVATHVRSLARGLTAAGHQVVVACPAAVVDRLATAGDGIRWAPVDVGPAPHPVRDARAVRALRTLAADAEVIHAHGARAGALAVLARGRRAGGPRLVVTTHNAAPEGRAGRAVYAALEALVARGSDLVLGVSPDLVARAGRAGARQAGHAVVAAPSAPSPPSRPQPGRGEEARTLRAALGLPAHDGPLLVVNAGRLSVQKDQETLVAAMHLLEGARPGGGPGASVVTLVAGEGPQRAALEAAVAAGPADVRLLGHRDDLPALLAAADVVVSTARWEGQPVWLQEALQAGAAIVATDVGGTAVVLGDGGLLVPVDGLDRAGRARAMADALAPLLADDEARSALRRRAVERAAQLPTEADALAAALAAYRA